MDKDAGHNKQRGRHSNPATRLMIFARRTRQCKGKRLFVAERSVWRENGLLVGNTSGNWAKQETDACVRKSGYTARRPAWETAPRWKDSLTRGIFGGVGRFDHSSCIECDRELRATSSAIGAIA